MRIKALVKHNLRSTVYALKIFCIFFFLGTFFGSIISSSARDVSVGVRVSPPAVNGFQYSFGVTILSFLIFIGISSLIEAQSQTKFFITRSASRKEIFLSSCISLVPISIVLALLQILTIYADGFVRFLLTGNKIAGIASEIQYNQAPNMNNIFVFFLVSVSMIMTVSAVAYLIGSCMARWKIATIGVLIIFGMLFIASFAISDFLKIVIDVFKFMFTDENNGLFIALKHLIFTGCIFAVAFPVQRRITATKQ